MTHIAYYRVSTDRQGASARFFTLHFQSRRF